MKKNICFNSIFAVLFIICILIFASAVVFADDNTAEGYDSSTDAQETLVPIDVPMAEENMAIIEFDISSKRELLNLFSIVGIEYDASEEEMSSEDNFPRKFTVYSGEVRKEDDLIIPVIQKEAKNHRGEYSVTVAVNQFLSWVRAFVRDTHIGGVELK